MPAEPDFQAARCVRPVAPDPGHFAEIMAKTSAMAAAPAATAVNAPGPGCGSRFAADIAGRLTGDLGQRLRAAR